MTSDTLERLHPLQVLLGSVLSGLDDLGDPALWSLGDGELDAVLSGVHRVVDRLRAREADLVTEAVHRDRAGRVGASSATVWLAGLLHVSPGSARRVVAGANSLARAGRDPVSAPVAGDARPGACGVEQAVVVADAVAALPADLPAGTREEAVAVLREHARVFDPERLRVLGVHLVEVLDPDGADTRAAQRLADQDRRAYDRRFLTLGPEVDGLVRGRFALPTAAAAGLRAALDPLAKPRPAASAADGTASDGATDGVTDGATDGQPDGARGNAPDGSSADPWTDPNGAHAATATRDGRSHPQRMADALTELARRALMDGALPTRGGERPQVVVTIGWDQLRDRTGAAHLPDGSQLSPAAARQQACDSSVLPAVLGGAGQPLDIGRETRTVPTGLRRALVLRDGGCAFPDCDRPPAWTDAHHVRHWADGGQTKIGNLVLLCGHHHRVTHHSPWEVTITPDGTVTWRPPPWVAPEGTTIPARPRPATVPDVPTPARL